MRAVLTKSLKFGLVAGLAMATAACATAASPSTNPGGASVAASSASANASPSPSGNASPTESPPADVSARRYDCAKLFTAAEVGAAWGVPVQFVRQQFGTDTYGPPESTGCSFATSVGPPPYMDVGINVNTGQAVAVYQQAIFSAPGVVTLPGIGERAAFVETGNSAAAGAMVRGVLIIVKLRNTTPAGEAPVPNARAAAERLLKLVAGRV